MTVNKCRVCMLLLACGVGRALFAFAGSPPPRPPGTAKLELRLIRRHPHASIQAVSADGRLMILWRTRKSVVVVRIPSSPESAKEATSSLDSTTVVLVDVRTGKELGSAPAAWWPTPKFFPDGQRVLYHSRRGAGREILRWNLANGQTETCLSGPAVLRTKGATPVSATEAIAVIGPDASPSFARLRADDCSVLQSAPADPADPRSRVYSDRTVIVSPNRRLSAYAIMPYMSPPKGVVLRSTSDLRVLHRLEAPERWTYFTLAFSADSKLLLAGTINSAGDPEVDAVWVYEAESGRLVKRMDINARYGLALSPDNKLLAVGQKRTRRSFFGERAQGVVALHDFDTGEELATVEYPEVPASQHFAGELGGLAFTPDGKYLITSENETRVYEIVRRP